MSLASSSTPGATPRTPHSPAASPGSNAGSMASSPRGAAGAVRPVTARTWQALQAGEPGSPGAGGAADPASPRRMSLYTNDLYRGGGQAAGEGEAPRPASPLYQPASARPRTPTPKPTERLQQQRIATSSRLQAERATSLPAGVATGAAAAALHAHAAVQPGSPLAAAQHEARPGTAPAPCSPLRMSTFSLAAAAAARPHAEGDASPRLSTAGVGASSIAVDSPRVRQQVLRGFAGAVPTGAADGSHSPRPALHGERARPSTPSFQPIALAQRPATAMAGPQPSAAAAASAAASMPADNFTIKASHGRAGPGPAFAGPVGAYPQPPSTAPQPKAPAALDPSGGGGHRHPAAAAGPAEGSLASFGIAAGAFIAPAPKTGGNGAVTAAAAAAGAVLVRLQADLLAAAEALTTKADLRRFLAQPGPADRPLRCKILRSGGGLLKGAPQYSLLVELEGGRGGAFLVAARKRKGGPGGHNYVLSVDQHDMSRHGASFVGKLRSNFLGTEFVLDDGGAGGENGGGKEGRCELAAAMYQTNVLGTKGPRKMTVVMPKLEPGGQRPRVVAPTGEHDTLLGQYKSYDLSGCVVLRNKPPRWNDALGAYCLNFGGRVTQASVKNFQLVSVDNMERTILQFGKVLSDAFTMDYSYPMTALQAFAICLSSFDSKLACE